MFRFRFLLWLIGVVLFIASRLSKHVSGQLSRDMTIVVASDDGVVRSFIIRARKVTSVGKSTPHPILRLRFRSAAIGFRILLAPNAIGQILDALGTLDVICEGEAAYVLWFYELIMGIKPWQKKPHDIWPQSYTAPDSRLKVADRIIREPILDNLDPTWHNAHQQRKKTILWQVGEGAHPWGKVKDHHIVVDLETPTEKIR